MAWLRLDVDWYWWLVIESMDLFVIFGDGLIVVGWWYAQPREKVLYFLVENIVQLYFSENEVWIFTLSLLQSSNSFFISNLKFAKTNLILFPILSLEKPI